MDRRNVILEKAVRVFADAVMLNASLFVGVVFAYVYGRRTDADFFLSFGSFAALFVHSFWVLSAISLTVFFATGFYSKGRAYYSRYKALVVAHAVTFSFLLFGLANYMFRFTSVPRKTYIVAFICTLASLETARLWARLWTLITANDSPAPRQAKKSNDSVLLIGGAGFIGSALLPKLLSRGYRVRLLDLFVYGQDPIAAIKNHPNLEIVEADFRQVDKVVKAMQGMSAVIHLGAIVGDPACALNEDLTVETNLVATRLIAEVAKGQGLSRFIFASTCSVYGASDEILNERSALNPVSLYARSKIASERVLTAMRDEHFRPVILRFGTIYGLSGRTRFDLVVNLLTAKAVVERKITVFGASQWRPFVHVDDAADAVMTALEARSELISHCIFNVGSDEQNTTLGEVGQLIKRLVPTAELIVSDPDGDRRNYRVDFRRIRDILGFQPKWTLEAGVRQIMDALRSDRVIDYRDSRYSNVKFLSEEGAEVLQARGDWVDHLLRPERIHERAKARAYHA